MKKIFFMLQFINLIALSIPEPYEVELVNVRRTMCPICESIFTQQRRAHNLVNQKNKILQNLENWINSLHEDPLKKEQLKKYYTELARASNNVVVFMLHDSRAERYLKEVKDLIDEIDPLVSEQNLRLEQNEFYEILREILFINSQLKEQNLPGNYQEWLAKRTDLS